MGSRSLRLLQAVLSAVLLSIVSGRAAAAPVEIGVITPLTGGLSDRGEEVRRTIDIFQRQYLSPSEFTFSIEDGKNGIGNSAITAAQKFTAIDKVHFLITTTSGETLQAARIAEQSKTVTIGVLATIPEIRTAGDYIFRTYVDIERGLELLMKDMMSRGRRIAVISEEAPFTAGIAQIITRIGDAGIVRSETFAPETQDFRALLVRIQAAHPDAVYLNCSSPVTFIPLYRQLRDAGVTQPVYSYFMPGERASQNALGNALEGVRFLYTPQVENDSPAFREFMATYLQVYPDGPKVEFLIRSTHDALKALTDSIRAAGPDSGRVKDYLYKISFKGALGDVSFDAAGDVKNMDFALLEIRSGKAVPASVPAR